jgi:hypothetical protein
MATVPLTVAARRRSVRVAFARREGLRRLLERRLTWFVGLAVEPLLATPEEASGAKDHATRDDMMGVGLDVLVRPLGDVERFGYGELVDV